MDYDLTRLGEKQFEQLAQSLIYRVVGSDAVMYGAGPDGGREAAWKGCAESDDLNPPALPGKWNGYNVAQAKYCNDVGTPAQNARWILKHIKEEFVDWTKEGTKRGQRPDSYLVITNVKLSAAPRSGYDKVRTDLLDYAQQRGLVLKNLRIWHYEQIRVMLENFTDIRVGYTAWITPGDILSQLLSPPLSLSADFSDALGSHAAKLLLEGARLNLSQAGSVKDQDVNLSDVYIDLPAHTPREDEHETVLVDEHQERNPNRGTIRGITAELVALADKKLDGAAIKSNGKLSRACRIVIVGGPGQGKSTVTQYLTQLYRACFMQNTSNLDAPEVRKACETVTQHARTIGLPLPVARRWPMRIVLTELADSLSRGTSKSILEFISNELGKRSSRDISVSDLRAWIKAYPWLIVFDGLDEVPVSSNRDEVLSAISDFYIDARGVGADILVVTTTRPQGYNNDFGHDECRHYVLAPLSMPIALSYARSIIDKRLGKDTSKSQQVYARLERAARDANTSILMSTPLQTTILTILVERLGHAPRDRWRLFSSYYRVIYQREQEKGGPLAELLQDHESDINFVHYKIGFILQRRGESSGDATSSISKEEFRTIISERMIGNGNTEDVAYNLANEIVRLATDRLVFLAVLRSEAIGFEIRSLQEYMAAEMITSGPESDIDGNIRAIAESDYWQNVLLFVAGYIFAQKEHLCAQLIALCSELNNVSTAHRAALPGSHLAHALLLERIASSKPRYSKLLAVAATELLRQPPSLELSTKLTVLPDLGHLPELESALRESVRGSLSQRLSAAITLSMLVAQKHEWAVNLLSDLIDEVNEEASLFFSLGIATSSVPLLKRMRPLIEQMDYRTVIVAIDGTLAAHDSAIIDALPEYIAAIITATDLDHRLGDHPAVKFDLYGNWFEHWVFRRGIDSLEPIARYHGYDPSWVQLSQLAQCALRYNRNSLIDAIQIALTVEPGLLDEMARVLPWPFNTCLLELTTRRYEHVRSELYEKIDEFGGKSHLPMIRAEELIEAIQLGQMGDSKIWQAVLERSVLTCDYTIFERWNPLIGARTGRMLPFSPSDPPEIQGICAANSLSAGRITVGTVDPEEWVRNSLEFVARLPIGNVRCLVIDMVSFVLDFPTSREGTESGLTVTLDDSVLSEVVGDIGRRSYETSVYLHLASTSGRDFTPEIAHRISEAEIIDPPDRIGIEALDLSTKGRMIPWRHMRVALGSFGSHIPSSISDRIDYGTEIELQAALEVRSMATAIDLLNGFIDISNEMWLREYIGPLINADSYIWEDSQYSRRRFRCSLEMLRARAGDFGIRGLAFAGDVATYLKNVRPTHASGFVNETHRMLSRQLPTRLSFE
ncbi:NACHT domain-containing protein [Nocardia brasiliensis]|uniref:NACHT domain-containing protein n=1 Tax=Nocardia brasiliensis TaxID=37326 RepID=UPI0024540C1A|nr:hypothetical protein [Nocardia brasiliensis]